MNHKTHSIHQKGFTVIEVAVSAGIFVVLAVIVAQVYFLIINQVVAYREQIAVSSLADQYLEIVRNLPYSAIGTVSGNPHGNLADSVNPINATVNGGSYQLYYEVTYLDDPADGTILAGTDFASDDYKQIKLNVKNMQTQASNNFFSTIAPKGLEGLASGGALSIQVFDAVGQPVFGASVHIQNSALNPSIDLTRTSDAGGNWVEVGLPNSVNSYRITVTKNGYSTDQTYPNSVGNPNPVKPDATVSNGQVTQISFSIDKTSTLTFNVQDQICSPTASIDLAVQGAKLIGTPSVLKFNNNYTSNGSGQVVLNNIEWDTYTPALSSLNYMVYGTSPILQVSVLPNTTQTFTLIVGPKTSHAFLVIVKDSANGNAIEGATVRLQSNNPSVDSSKYTAGSIWNQQDWASGTHDGNLDIDNIPSGLRLLYFNNQYVSSGVFTSSIFDTGTEATAYTTLEWQPPSQNPATALKFQLATNNDNLTWNYFGPDGTANSYYTVSGTTINAIHNNTRYIRYKAFLSTTNSTQTPVLTSININYVSGCFTPGQAMFDSLTSGNNYSVAVNATGYQTQTIDNINISGYNVLTVLMTP